MQQDHSSGKLGTRRSGFTRTEVVSALGIAGALSAIVLPVAAQGGLFSVFSRARENARRASCQSNQKQIMLGLIQYSQDYDEKFPLAASTGKGADPGSGSYSASFGWADALDPYLKSKQLYVCPSERRPNAASWSSKGFTDYWLNRQSAGKSLASFASPSQSIAVGDGDGGSASSNARYSISSLPPGWAKTPRSPARRHLGGANYAFLDGHVKFYLPKSISGASLAKAGGNPTFSIK